MNISIIALFMFFVALLCQADELRKETKVEKRGLRKRTTYTTDVYYRGSNTIQSTLTIQCSERKEKVVNNKLFYNHALIAEVDWETISTNLTVTVKPNPNDVVTSHNAQGLLQAIFIMTNEVVCLEAFAFSNNIATPIDSHDLEVMNSGMTDLMDIMSNITNRTPEETVEKVLERRKKYEKKK